MGGSRAKGAVRGDSKKYVEQGLSRLGDRVSGEGFKSALAPTGSHLCQTVSGIAIWMYQWRGVADDLFPRTFRRQAWTGLCGRRGRSPCRYCGAVSEWCGTAEGDSNAPVDSHRCRMVRDETKSSRNSNAAAAACATGCGRAESGESR